MNCSQLINRFNAFIDRPKPMFLHTYDTVSVVIASSFQVVFTTGETIYVVGREIDSNLFILHYWLTGERLQQR